MPYQMTNGKWRAVKMIDGQRKTKQFATKQEARKWEAAQSREAWQEGNSPIHTVCWLELITAYLDMVQGRLAKGTYVLKKYIARLSLNVIPPEQQAREVTVNQALEIMRICAATSGHKANKARSHLASAWKWGVRFYGLPKTNPFLECEKFPEIRQPRRVPTMAEFWRVYDAAGEDDKVFLLLLLHTGARIGEVLRLVWDDVDFENGRIRLGTRKTGGAGMRYDWLPMTGELQGALEALRKRYLFQQFVFVNRHNGEQLKKRVHFMERICLKAGVPRFGYHGIRHLAATALAYAGVDLPTVQAMLRHTTPTTTARYIASLGIDRNKIEEAFKQKGAKVSAFTPKKAV